MAAPRQQRVPEKEPPPGHKGELDYLTVSGFRSIKAIEKMALRPLNVLVGANGAGKSNLLRVFSLLRVLRQGKLAAFTEEAGGADKLLHFGSKKTKSIELEISFGQGVNGYRVSLSPTAEDALRVHDEACWYWNKEYARPFLRKFPNSGKEAGISKPNEELVGWVQKRLDSWRTYHFHDTSQTALVKKTGDLDDNRFLRSDARNLAAYLHLLAKRHPADYQLIRKMVQRVAPFFDDFRVEPLRRNPSKIKLEWVHKTSEGYFDVASLSDGSLRFMCLATLFLQPVGYRPSVILVDEPELGLHPYAITMLANMIKSAATQTQIIVSTQSPLLLDHFEPEDVLVADLEKGATTVRRLSSEKLGVWLEEYSLGQLWEKNEFGGRPTRG
jgi:predicted ATPase